VADQDKDEERSSYSSPIIATIGATNTIQTAIQKQFEAIFEARSIP
jgi:hypothetical protein